MPNLHSQPPRLVRGHTGPLRGLDGEPFLARNISLDRRSGFLTDEVKVRQLTGYTRFPAYA